MILEGVFKLAKIPHDQAKRRKITQNRIIFDIFIPTYSHYRWWFKNQNPFALPLPSFIILITRIEDRMSEISRGKSD